MAKQSAAKVREGIGLRISEVRRSSGTTQEQLANRLDVSVQWVSRLENSHENPTVDALVRIANALGVEVAMLFEAPGRVANLPDKVPRKRKRSRRR